MDQFGWLDRWFEADSARESADFLRSKIREQKLLKENLKRRDLALLGERYWPKCHYAQVKPQHPGTDVAFLIVANDRFYRGLEALLLSLLSQYPALDSQIIILHDGTLKAYLQRRLLQIYTQIRFDWLSPSWASFVPKKSKNQERIGFLGYLNSQALALRGYRRVIVLDSDLLITGPLDPLWAEGEDFRAIPDCGETPWAAVSPHTGRPILNSGVLSVPGWALNPSCQNQFEDLIRRSSEASCPLLDCFADQKAWNLFLVDKPVKILPVNFNCNVKYLVRYLGGCADGISIVHFAGPKPWLTWPWVKPDPSTTKWGAVTDHLFWNRYYRHLLLEWRVSLFQQMMPERLPRKSGPTTLATNPMVFQTKECPVSCERHLLLSDTQIFLPSWPDSVCWPAGWLQAIAAASPLTIWAPFEWEPAVRHLQLPDGVSWRWLLIEAPFSPALKHGEDLIADEFPGAYRFEPWSDPPSAGVERAARCQLLAAGFESVISLAYP